jgi:hypothetical protein
MFVRYAYPPNALGYCGPDGFRDYAEAGVVDQGLVKQVQAFSGAWPYLELISSGCGIKDPLDRRVVEATGSAASCSTGWPWASSATRWPSGSASRWGTSSSS